MTLEEAQAEIVRLNDRVTELTNERDTLSQNNNTLIQDNEALRTLNQNYFNRLSAQFQNQEPDKDDGGADVPSCEEFAKTLTI